MAHRKTPYPTVMVEDISELIEMVRDNILPHTQDPTQFIVPSISGTIDPFTEEVEFHTIETLFNASGIVGSIMQEDMLLGIEGQVQVGDTKVTYPYDVVSGVLGFESVDQIKLLGVGISGLYHISAMWTDVIGNMPIFVDFALKPDRNG